MGQKKSTASVAKAGTSGGAAAAGGAAFQQSVAAYVLAHVATGDLGCEAFDLPTGFAFKSLHMETALAIDDVVICGNAHRALIQAKAALSMSDSVGSQYSAVIEQFVKHHLSGSRPGDVYVLATSLRSSTKIVLDLSRLVESVRLNGKALTENPHTGAEREVIDKTRKLVMYHLKKNSVASPDEGDFLAVFRRIYVLALDLESAKGRDSKMALLRLKPKAAVNPELLWEALMGLARSLATERGSIDLTGLMDRVSAYIRPLNSAPTSLVDEIGFEVLMPRDASSGKELVAFHETVENAQVLIIAQSQRFDADGSRTTKFTRDGFKLRDGHVQPILARTSTQDGIGRFLEEHQDYISGREIRLSVFGATDGLEEGPWAIAHRQLINGLLRESGQRLRCLICDSAISEDLAYLVEIDEEDQALAAGVAHRRCHYASLRILGTLRSDLFAKYTALRDFDYNGWMRAAHRGLSAALAVDFSQPAKFVWRPLRVGASKGSWCVRIDAFDGTSHYCRRRGKVERFIRADAEAEALSFRTLFAQGLELRDPWCVSEDRQMFAQLAVLLKEMPRGMRALKCVGATAVPFDQSIDKAYSSGIEYYAPLTLLVDPQKGCPLEVSGCVLLLTDPTRIRYFLDNWSVAGMDTPSFAVEIIEDDMKFDALIGASLKSGLRPLVDPLFAAGELLQGVEMVSLDDFENAS